MKTEKIFPAIETAVSWLNAQSGLWAGLTEDDQSGIYDCLETEGFASVRNPKGEVFTAIVPD
jgi:hypothetical protein